MGVAYSIYGVEVCTGFWWRNLRERDHLEDPGEDVWIILRWTLRLRILAYFISQNCLASIMTTLHVVREGYRGLTMIWILSLFFVCPILKLKHWSKYIHLYCVKTLAMSANFSTSFLFLTSQSYILKYIHVFCFLQRLFSSHFLALLLFFVTLFTIVLIWTSSISAWCFVSVLQSSLFLGPNIQYGRLLYSFSYCLATPMMIAKVMETCS
jgi:hypothetical protein